MQDILDEGYNPIAHELDQIISLMRHKLPQEFFDYNRKKPHEYIIRIDDNKFKIIRQDDVPSHKRFLINIFLIQKIS